MGEEIVEVDIGEHHMLALRAPAHDYVPERSGSEVGIDHLGRAPQPGRSLALRAQTGHRVNSGLRLPALAALPGPPMALGSMRELILEGISPSGGIGPIQVRRTFKVKNPDAPGRDPAQAGRKALVRPDQTVANLVASS